jgi:hypothetical protein
MQQRYRVESIYTGERLGTTWPSRTVTLRLVNEDGSIDPFGDSIVMAFSGEVPADLALGREWELRAVHPTLPAPPLLSASAES